MGHGPKKSGVRAQGRVLVVASTGGHLAQAVRLVDSWDIKDRAIFYTFESEQSRSLLAGREFVFGPYVAPRDVVRITTTTCRLVRIAASLNASCIISTGAGVAISAALTSALLRKPMTFVESISRFDGPSASGRVLRWMPWVRRFTQHSAWADKNWLLTDPLLGQPGAISKAKSIELRSNGPLTLFVSLGTIQPFRFDALIESIMSVLKADDVVTWQLGATSRNDLPGNVFEQLPAEDFDRHMEQSDLFITHAGVGTIMRALELGASMLVVPRRADRHEHVDDHQLQVARMLADKELAEVCEPGDLTRALLYRAAVRLNG